jgi:hypothetical protein
MNGGSELALKAPMAPNEGGEAAKTRTSFSQGVFEIHQARMNGGQPGGQFKPTRATLFLFSFHDNLDHDKN